MILVYFLIGVFKFYTPTFSQDTFLFLSVHLAVDFTHIHIIHIFLMHYSDFRLFVRTLEI